MKHIAIFCDGTWQGQDNEHPSNVRLLADALVGAAPDGARQQGVYLPGVGAGNGQSGIGARFDRLTGGAFGWGLDANIEDAYRAVMDRYAPGDAIHVFGFSRGAYTARSLVGLIRRAGVMQGVHKDRVGEAMALYRTRDDPTTKSDSERMMKRRADLAPATATSVKELDWRRANGRHVPERVLELAYLGIWDTVGALGVPGHLTVAPIFNHRYQFHDTDLSALVLRARHAVAVDERRRSFEPTLWTNLKELNLAALGLPKTGDLSTVPLEFLPYRQEWFPGDHGSVGGGNPIRGLSAYACGWIAEGAEKAGLAFDQAKLAAIQKARRIGDPLSTTTGGFWRLGDREGPDDPRTVSEAVRERVKAFGEEYAPKTLDRVRKALTPGT